MERDFGEAKQSNSDQKKYSNFNTFIGFNFISTLINGSIPNQSNTVQISIDLVFQKINKFVEDNVHGETIRPIQLNHSLQTPSFPTLVSFLFNY